MTPQGRLESRRINLVAVATNYTHVPVHFGEQDDEMSLPIVEINGAAENEGTKLYDK